MEPCMDQHIHMENRAEVTSAVAGTEMLASVSNQSKDLPAVPPASAGEDNQRLVQPIASSASDKSKGRCISPDTECENGENTIEANSNIEDSPMDVAATPMSPDAVANDTSRQTGFGSDAHLDEIRKISTYKIRPVPRMITRSTVSQFDLTGDTFKALKDQRGPIRDLYTSARLPRRICQAFKDLIKQEIISPIDIEVTFENFPYQLSENTKNVLLSCSFLHLKKKEFIMQFPEISSINQRILLSGPAGSQIYQETLIKALAKHFGARLLVVNSLLLPGVPSKDPETQKDVVKTDKSGDKAGVDKLEFFHNHCSSLANADIDTATLHFATLPKQESTFGEGERVRYVGPAQLSAAVHRGPCYGYRGTVMYGFEENGLSKIGVRFDKQIPGGNDLGGLCEEDHGFFCSADLLRPDISGGEEVVRLAMTEFIEVISEESKNGSLIVLLKDLEKSFTGVTESFSSLRNKLELLPPGVLIVGSHTQMDSREEKAHPGGFLYTKFARSNQMQFNLFPDSPKAMKYLNELFPNKISIELPQDEALLTIWKQQLDRDVETLKAKSNIRSIRSFLSHSAIECNDLEELFIKDRSLTNDNVDKIVGYAVSYHLKNNEVQTSKGGKLVLTSESLKHGLDMLQSLHSDNKSSKKSLKEEGGSGILDGMSSNERVDITSAYSALEHIILDESMEPTNLPLALLQYVTENFTDKREIGRGAFGVVYKGDLLNRSVAVKRLSNSHMIEEEPFNREAVSLIGVKHPNIVRFLGYCANTERKAMIHTESGETTAKYIFAEIIERLLCFEYVNNGSLDKYLTDELRGLEWHTRYKIIRGICDGLVYLHREKCIVHMDMKPANILLDDLMIPQITDFGISKLLQGATHVVTSNFAGTLGYCAPEFINCGVVSIKSDVYSLGVIIKEIVTGRRSDPDIKHVLRRWRYRWNKSVEYPPLGYEQVTKCIEIALRCLSDFPKGRPYVWEIVSMLNELESTNDHINNADKSPAVQISPYPWELLEFDKLELNFPFEVNKQVQRSLELTNVTDDCVAFDIETTSVLQCYMEPDKGIVPPRSQCNVMVTLQARNSAALCKDEFIVWCAVVDEGLKAEDITKHMFDRTSGKTVDEVTLPVVICPISVA